MRGHPRRKTSLFQGLSGVHHKRVVLSPEGLIFAHVFCWTRGVHGFSPNGASYPALRDQANGP
jgi:hypothetical protein